MSLIVHAMAAYASYPIADTPWRQVDYNINKLVKSLKGEPFNGYANMQDIDGHWRQITTQSDIPYYLFARWASQRLRDLNLGQIILVPVPSSSCITYDAVTTPVKMARSIQQMLGTTASVGQWLRFCEVMTRSHEGGTRNQAVMENQLRISNAVTPSRVVLVDDVKTTGSHLKACANRLREAGATIDIAIVAASTVWIQHQSPLNISPEELEFEIDIDGMF